jgi:hypothetical protein
VSTHFEALGFPVRSEAEARELLSTAFDRATDVVEHSEGQTATYRDPSGATLSIHVDRRSSFECCQPGFEGRFHARWRPVGIVRDEGCGFCDLVYAELLDDEDEMIYPFTLSVETLGAERALIPYEEPGEVRFAGLWEEGEVWPDEAAFTKAQEEEWADVPAPEELDVPSMRGFASRSLVPSGTFTFEGGPMSSHVLAHGIVSSVEERHNELGDAPYRFVRLDTLGGVFDTCLAPGTVEGEELLAPGAVARATLWLVGRPLTLRDEPGPVPVVEDEQETEWPGRLRRLFGRR